MGDRFERETGHADAERSSTSMVRLLGQMMMLPLTVFVYGMELFVRTMQGMQRATDKGVDVMAGAAARTPDGPSTLGDLASNTTGSVTDGTLRGGAETICEEEKKMDQDLSGEDTLKLVRYKILFVKRDYEVAFKEKEELVSYSTTGADWAALRIAHFMGHLKETKRPEKWRECHYPPGVTGEFIDYIPKEDQKYIRIYFEVLQRWEREEAEYDKQQVKVLREIRDQIGEASRKIG